MDWLATAVVGLNGASNALGRVLAPVGLLPGWLSATLVAVATGVVMLVVFKYTSNQRAIKRVRQGIRANLLAARLFRDNFRLAVRSQGRVLAGALRLLLLAVVPILAMIVPVTLLLSQLALWYQARPLRVGEEAVVVVKLGGDASSPMPVVTLEPTPGAEDVSGPVRATGPREVCWNVAARTPGYHTLRFVIDGRTFEKELAVGDGFMRVSLERPPRNWEDALAHPREQPFAADSVVQSIRIEYPNRTSRVSGMGGVEDVAQSWTEQTGWWVGYWFVVSLIAGFCLRGALRVNL